MLQFRSAICLSFYYFLLTGYAYLDPHVILRSYVGLDVYILSNALQAPGDNFQNLHQTLTG